MPRTMTSTDLWDLPRVGSPSASDDGDVVVVPVTTHDEDGAATTRLWLHDGDRRTALTSAETSAGAPVVSPGGRSVAFTRAVDGHAQLHVLPLDGGEARRVTDLPLGVRGSARWVDEQRLLVVTSVLVDDPTTAATAAWRDAADERPDVIATERRISRTWDTWRTDPLTEHVLLFDLTTPDAEPVDLTPGEWMAMDPLTDPGSQLATDGTRLAWATADPDGDDDGVPLMRVRVVPLEGGTAPTEVLPDAPAGVTSPAFLPDGRLLVRVARERDFYACPADLVVVDLDAGTSEVLLDGAALDLGVDAVAVGADGTIVVGTEVRGRGRFLRLDADGSTTELAAPDDGGLSGPVVAGGRVLGTTASVSRPPEVAEVTDTTVTTLTSFVADAGWADVAVGRLEEREVAGHGGDPVQVLVLHPPTEAVSDPTVTPPLVHLVHGGPHGTFGDTWSWRWAAQRWAAEGWAVAMVNFHGSTSFGHAWTRSIQGDWRTAPVADVIAATDALVADGTADPERVAIAGGSYGGYLVTMLACEDQRWSCVVAHAAVTDFGGMWATDWNNGFSGAFGGTLWEDPAALDHASPHRHYAGLESPTLVLHGDRDYRVPIDQGRALYGVLQSKRVPSRLVVFPHENHWILHRDTSLRWYDEVLGWLHRHLDA